MEDQPHEKTLNKMPQSRLSWMSLTVMQWIDNKLYVSDA